MILIRIVQPRLEEQDQLLMQRRSERDRKNGLRQKSVRYDIGTVQYFSVANLPTTSGQAELTTSETLKQLRLKALGTGISGQSSDYTVISRAIGHRPRNGLGFGGGDDDDNNQTRRRASGLFCFVGNWGFVCKQRDGMDCGLVFLPQSDDLAWQPAPKRRKVVNFPSASLPPQLLSRRLRRPWTAAPASCVG
ncbi:hypothetical protein B7463_g3643, partial [Scytalidium lignicola]